MIEVKNLTKTYGNHDAIRDLSFKITNGKIYGLLGPNGAGKSTTMNIMTGCLSATSGTVRINGFDIYDDPVEAKKCIGYLPEIPPLYADMTPFEYLSFVAEAKGVSATAANRQVREVMELTQISDMENRLIRNLSKGYKQRVGIAQAMLGNPEIIILDEPTVGLDPKQLIEIRELIRQLGENRTVIISSHILSEIREICDELLVISGGKLVANGTMEELEGMVGDRERLHLVIRGDREGILGVLDGVAGAQQYTVGEEKDGTVALDVDVARGTDLRDDIFFAMADKRYAVITMEKEQMTLESVFLALTDEEAAPADAEEKEQSAADAEPEPENADDEEKEETEE